MNWIIKLYFTFMIQQPTLKKIWDFLGVCYIFRNRKETWTFSQNKNHLWTHQRYADFQTACVLRSLIEQVPEDPLDPGWSAYKTHSFCFCIYTMYHKLYNFTFETIVKLFICNVMVVLLYLLCTLDLILNVESTPEMFPPSVFGVWQIGIRALVYSE